MFTCKRGHSVVNNTHRLILISVSATLQTERSHFCDVLISPESKNPSRVTGVIHAAVAKTITATR